MNPVSSVAHVMRRFTLEKWGGTETVVFQLSREFESRGIRSPIHCTSMLSRPGAERVGPVRVNRHRYVLPWIGLSDQNRHDLVLKGGSPLAPGVLWSLLREPGLQVIHAHVQKRLGGMARTAAKMRGIPYVVSIHGGHFSTPDEQTEKMTEPFRGKPEWGKAFGWLLGSRKVLEDASAILCVGKVEAELMKEKLPSKRVEYVPNGVRAGDFRGAPPSLFRERYGLPAGDPLVLCVSRIDFQKNQLLLVRAFARFAAAHPRHRLVLVGPVTVEDYRRRIEEEALRLGVAGRLLLVPGLKPGDPALASAYAASEIFVLPSAHEPFGIVVLEAWAAGVPVAASRVGGIPGFVEDGADALLFTPGSEDELVDRLARLAGDAALREGLARRGAARVEREFDWANIASRVLEIYAGCAANLRRAR
jgi:glycosyltransferase involved in cell wall biosynthesis